MTYITPSDDVILSSASVSLAWTLSNGFSSNLFASVRTPSAMTKRIGSRWILAIIPYGLQVHHLANLYPRYLVGVAAPPDIAKSSHLLPNCLWGYLCSWCGVLLGSQFGQRRRLRVETSIPRAGGRCWPSSTL